MSFLGMFHRPAQASEPSHEHSWYVVAVAHYYDTSFGAKAPSTNIIQRCRECGDIKRESLFNVGFLTVEQLNAAPPTEEHRS